MNAKATIEISPMECQLGDEGMLISFTGAAEVLVEMENVKNHAEMEEALARVKMNYEDIVAHLPQLLDYDAQDSIKIKDTFWVLNQVRKFLGGVKILR